MFFPEKIKSIKDDDKVLEIGPGGTPFERADVFLDRKFDNESEAKFQRGNTEKLKTSKPVFFYDGKAFPFKDKEFDYVICSHVIEHVEDVESFLNEIVRVAKAGYIEFPTVYYEYLYNFDPHLNFVSLKNDTIFWMPKSETKINDFKSINKFFFETLNKSYVDLVNDLKEYMFQGFEWKEGIKHERVAEINDLIFEYEIDNIEKSKEQLILELNNTKSDLNQLRSEMESHKKTMLCKVQSGVDYLKKIIK
ncbi:MAG: Methyltransferase type 11 [Candidatus Moranbacteria bacterium GW2011_GWE1_36_7]|nr:MAG: Methyltransferase type 11 [Candidatus Moranbacteria bacterium GW2011_GWD2_36_12]KKQ05805.1 MAG: Methyltransferase type 11 [Candidatus Moranbacteria bacterium GW2011_GWE2_36_40]KKQ12372.1 MAG: Methyltransferase type 11 [Candidatus Moranbacteria bacterium GW2011_GWE1_36_7]